MTGSTRRQVVGGLAGSLGGVALTLGIGRGAAASSADAYWPRTTRFPGFDERSLAVQQIGRRERLHLAFRTPDRVVDMTAVNRLSFLFRDWRDEDMGLRIDVRLFDILATVQTLLTAAADRPVPLLLHSGYRTPERNATIEGAVEHSQHIIGRAADISADGLDHGVVARAAEIAGAHGLGRYGDFTHIDVGPEGRRWGG